MKTIKHKRINKMIITVECVKGGSETEEK